MKGKTICPCGCGKDIDEKLKYLLAELDKIVLDKTGYEIEITSGARCYMYNTKIGGAKNSAHQLGLAVDIATPTSRVRYWVVKMIYDFGIKRWGWNRDKKFIHLDLATSQTLMPDGTSYYKEEIAFDY